MIDAKAVPEGVKLTFFNPSTGGWEEILDKEYRSYFFVPYPLSQEDEGVIKELGAKIRLEEKKDLFTDLTVKVVRVEIQGSSDTYQDSRRFEKTWEGEIPYILGYVYDKGLVFGAQHLIKGNYVKPVLEVPEEAKFRFEERFSDVKESDPAKYDLLERWLALCSQPILEFSTEKLGVLEKVDREQYYLASMLSRVANIPVAQAFSNHQVSSWIKSILHNHLRRNNILIPTSRELRRDETEKTIQGALTFQPESGVYFNTVVVDFESLYPSIIDAYNLSYETVDCSHPECKDNLVPGLEHHICRRRRGLYSVLIGSLKDLRIRWFKQLAKDENVSTEERRLAEATSQLLKLILVSSYGVTIRIHGLARPSLAESITAYGRYCLQTTWNIAKEAGLHPIYGDTDSLFLDNPTDLQVNQLIKAVKEQLYLDLAVDEQYSVCVLTRAMKAYFGIRRDGTADIKGVTAIKSNSPVFIQKLFTNCVKEMANVKDKPEYEKAKESIQKIVRNAIKNLKSGKTPLKDLEYPVEIHEEPMKEMRETVLHQPYQCAIQLIDSGKPVQKGDTVNFIKVKPFQYKGRTFTVKPTEQVRSSQEVNIEDYIRNLTTALNQTFKPMDIKFTEEKEKVALTDFM
jgi:DNA polymerase elongation subunit (family B)